MPEIAIRGRLRIAKKQKFRMPAVYADSVSNNQMTIESMDRKYTFGLFLWLRRLHCSPPTPCLVDVDGKFDKAYDADISGLATSIPEKRLLHSLKPGSDTMPTYCRRSKKEKSYPCRHMRSLPSLKQRAHEMWAGPDKKNSMHVRSEISMCGGLVKESS